MTKKMHCSYSVVTAFRVHHALREHDYSSRRQGVCVGVLASEGPAGLTSMLFNTLRKVKAMPPPMIISSTLSNMLLISWILSFTFALKRTDTHHWWR